MLVNRRTQSSNYPRLEIFLGAVKRRGASNGPTQHTRIPTAPCTHQSQPHRGYQTRRRRSRTDRDSEDATRGRESALLPKHSDSSCITPVVGAELRECEVGSSSFDPDYIRSDATTDDIYFAWLAFLSGTIVCLGTGSLIGLAFLTNGEGPVHNYVSLLYSFIGFGFGAGVMRMTYAAVLPLLL